MLDVRPGPGLDAVRGRVGADEAHAVRRRECDAGVRAVLRAPGLERGPGLLEVEGRHPRARIEVESRRGLVWEVAPENPFAVFGGRGTYRA